MKKFILEKLSMTFFLGPCLFTEWSMEKRSPKRLLVVRFWGSPQLHMDFQLCRGWLPLSAVSFKGQLQLILYRVGTYKVLKGHAGKIKC